MTRPCANCAAPFEVTPKRTKYCSKSCGRAGYQKEHPERARASNRASYEKHREAILTKRQDPVRRDAHREYMAKYREINQEAIATATAARRGSLKRISYMRTYNARPTTKARVKWRFWESSDMRIKRLAHNVLLRAPDKNIACEPIDPFEVFEAANWTCALCGGHMDLALGHHHPNYPTIDHVHAVALGGAHVRINVRAACLSCNASQGKAVRRQLRASLHPRQPAPEQS